MAQRIFLSFAKENTNLAEAIRIGLNRIFKRNIEVFLSSHNLKPGHDWRQAIKNNLEQCNTLISLITPESFRKPWIYIEWSPFWLRSDTKTYLLLKEGVNLTDLPGPMTDVQAAFLQNKISLDALLEEIARDASVSNLDYTAVDKLMTDVERACEVDRKEAMELGLGKYRNPNLALPESDAAKRDIAEFFLLESEDSNFKRTLEEIRSDFDRKTLFNRAIDLSNVDIARIILREITDLTALGECAKNMIDKIGPANSRQAIASIADTISGNQAELRKLCAVYLRNGYESDPIFSTLLARFTNTSEARKLAEWFVDEDKITNLKFDAVFKIVLGNSKASENLLRYIVDASLARTDAFPPLFCELRKRSEKAAKAILEYLLINGLVELTNELDKRCPAVQRQLEE